MVVSEFSIFFSFLLFVFVCCFCLKFSVGYCELFAEWRLQHGCGRSARLVHDFNLPCQGKLWHGMFNISTV